MRKARLRLEAGRLPAPWWRLRRLPARIALGAVGAAALTAAVLGMVLDLPRDSLWWVLRTCAIAQRTLGPPFPCDDLEAGPDGFAVLRAPGREAHYIVAPTERVAGLESRPDDAALTLPAWRAALDLRAGVTARTGAPLGDIVLAINPKRSRGQDQLHVHVGCGDPDLLDRIRAAAPTIGPAWTKLEQPVDGTAFWARRVGPAHLQGEDPFTSLRRLPDSQVDRTDVVFEAFGLERSGHGDVVHLATQTEGSSADDAFAESCGRRRDDQAVKATGGRSPMHAARG